MLQIIEGKSVYIVEFNTMPALPIKGVTPGEIAYEALDSYNRAAFPRLESQGTYAEALTNAIKIGIITKPGKYGIHIVPGTKDYEIFKL